MCIDILHQVGRYEPAGIVTNEVEASTGGLSVLGGDDDLEMLFSAGYRHAIIGIGAVKSPALRAQLFTRLKAVGFKLPTLVHPRAIVEPSATLGEGVQVMAGAIVGSSARVGDNSIINSGAIVSHDCILDSNVHITPGAILAGAVQVGKNAIVGMGSSIYMGIQVGNDAVIHNGVHVFKHIESGAVIKK